MKKGKVSVEERFQGIPSWQGHRLSEETSAYITRKLFSALTLKLPQNHLPSEEKMLSGMKTKLSSSRIEG